VSGSALKSEAAGDVEPGVAALVARDELPQGREHRLFIRVGQRRFEATAWWQKRRRFPGRAGDHDGVWVRGGEGPVRQQVRHDVSDHDARGDDGYQRDAMHADKHSAFKSARRKWYDENVKSEAIADEARRRNDDAVRRLREESRRRVAQRTPGMSVCMLGTMISMLLFVTLEARRQCYVARAWNAQAEAERACASFARRQSEIEGVKREQLASAFDAEEVRRIDARSRAQLETAHRFALEQGCVVPPLPPLPPPPRPTVFPVSDVWIVY